MRKQKGLRPCHLVGDTDITHDTSDHRNGLVKAAQNAAHWGRAKARADPDLAAVVQAWPALSAAIKADILAIIRAGGPDGSGK